MKKEVLKAKIQKKFGSMSNFARAANIDRYDLQKTFARKDIPKQELAGLIKSYEELDGSPTGGNVIDQDKLNRLIAMIQGHGGPYQFSKDNPQFNMREVYSVFNGERKRMCKLIERLFEHFKIE